LLHHPSSFWSCCKPWISTVQPLQSSVFSQFIHGKIRFEHFQGLLSQNISTIHQYQLQASSVSSLQHPNITVSLVASKSSKNSTLTIY
jgi:hypothetical protein